MTLLRFGYSTLLFLLATCLTAQSGQPNIVLVITDDQGKNDLGSEGNPYISTPNLDAFHDGSVRLTNFHVSPTCAPTRSALMTGRYANRLNVYHTIAGRSLLMEDEVLLPEVLGRAGYVNGMFGKWHLGDNYPFRPGDRGFDEVVRHGGGGIGQMPDYWGNDYFDDTYWHNGQPRAYQGYCTDVFFDEALSFIEANRDRPFFCYISTNAPHGPLNVPAEYYERYRGHEDLTENMARFYGMITNIDDNFGRLERTLDSLGLAENTIVIFMTDNGSAGGQQVYDAGMTGGKNTVTEGGHRVPFYVRWPAAGIGGGRDIDALAAHIDVLPTLVELLGIDYVSEKKIDGKSLLPLFTESQPEWAARALIVDTQREQDLVKYKDYAVMEEHWRLLNGQKLYNLKDDLKQEHDIAADHPVVVDRLSQAYEDWWASLLSEGADEQAAFIQIGSEGENPVRITSHDIRGADALRGWNQVHAIRPRPASGYWNIEVTTPGTYRFGLRRFPRESGLHINASFPEEEPRIELQGPSPASDKTDYVAATIDIAHHHLREEIAPEDGEVTFTLDLPTGQYGLEASLIDATDRVYFVHYLYVEKL